MNAVRATVPISVLGVASLLVGVVRPSVIPFAAGLSWLFLGLGAAYSASAASAWRLIRRGGPRFPIASLPAIVAPVATLVGYVVSDGIGLAGAPPVLVALSLVAIVFAVALAFPLGAASEDRYRWAVVGGVALAALPVVALGLATLAPGPPEERGILVLVGSLLSLVVGLPAVPLYVLGRSTRSATDVTLSPSPPLVALAIPYVLVLVAAVARPGLVRETVPGPALVVVPGIVLLAIGCWRWFVTR